jgi:putative flippase GtrA
VRRRMARRARSGSGERGTLPPSGRDGFRIPLGRRIIGYSAGSIVAAVLGELAFIAAFGWLHAGTTWATLAGFVGGAVPNYFLNRRWAWPDRSGRSRRSEVVLYFVVIAISFVASAIVTHWAEAVAVRLSPDRAWQTVMVAAAFLGVSGVFFVVKFVIYEHLVFRPAQTGLARTGPSRTAFAQTAPARSALSQAGRPPIETASVELPATPSLEP